MCTQMAFDLRRIVPEWAVSLPTYLGVLVQWGGTYLGITTESAPTCPIPHYRMSSTTHPPQLRNEGDWVRPGHTLVAFDHLYPTRCFPAAGQWHLRPPESSLVPPALHLWHYISGVSVYVPEKCIAQQGSGDVLYWFHPRPRLSERTQWPRFVL